jgi:hypothetical protein
MGTFQTTTGKPWAQLAGRRPSALKVPVSHSSSLLTPRRADFVVSLNTGKLQRIHEKF